MILKAPKLATIKIRVRAERRRPKRPDSFEPFKRGLDLAVAIAGLTLTFPLLLYCALRRRLSGRPILVREERLGRQGRRYVQYGFTGLERHPYFRKLPLLVNVIAGDMSLIGPRPVPPGDPAAQVDGSARLSVKPGVISSWWLRQRANIDFDDEAAADREYLRTASLATDLGIALRAIPALVFSEKRDSAPRTVEILGIRIDNLSMSEALAWIRQKLNGGGQAMVFMTNAHCANVSCVNPAYHRALVASQVNLADGVGLRIAAKLKRTAIRQNVNGTDLFPRLCAMLAGTGESLYLVGGRPGVAERVTEWIGKEYPDTAVAGYRNGYFQFHEEDSIAQAIRSSGASVLLVAMGVPQQELWIERNLAKTGVRIAIGVGGLFDFYSGRIPRAPEWMREIGLEWSYRLIQEPGRMWKRYLIGNWMFLARHLLYELNFYRPRSQATRNKAWANR
jgi:N-acetylglucosaminyldiphosphoundecaprenol N-acetyl-beta-D-mannosaminyltransferase